jgi:hypothetical protein
MSNLIKFIDSTESELNSQEKLMSILENFYSDISREGIKDNCPADKCYERIVQYHIQEMILNNGFDAWFEIIDRTDVKMKYDLLIKVKGIRDPIKVAPLYLQAQIKSSTQNATVAKRTAKHKTSIKKGVFRFNLTLRDIKNHYDELDFFMFYVGWVDEIDGVAHRAYSIFLVKKQDLIEHLKKTSRAKNPEVELDTHDNFWKERNGNLDAIREIALEHYFNSITALIKIYGTEETIKMIEDTQLESIVKNVLVVSKEKFIEMITLKEKNSHLLTSRSI